MPVNQQDKAVIVMGAPMIAAVKGRAEAEGRSMSAVVVDAVAAHLGRPSASPAPDASDSAGASARTSVPPTAGLESEVRALLGAVRELLPDVRRVVENHDETMDTLDQLAAEIGRREGAAHALEEVRAIADGRARGR